MVNQGLPEIFSGHIPRPDEFQVIPGPSEFRVIPGPSEFRVIPGLAEFRVIPGQAEFEVIPRLAEFRVILGHMSSLFDHARSLLVVRRTRPVVLFW